MDFDLMIHNLKNNIPFKYARYGDGEWNCILGKPGANCDGHQYFPDLGERLKSILESQPDYYLGLQNIAIDQNIGNSEFKRLVEKNTWCDNEILHRASINDYISLFFEAINNSNCLLIVRNKGLSEFGQSFPLGCEYIEIPSINCWLDYERVSKILLGLKRYRIILLSASMMSEVLIDDLKNTDHTIIDCGSVFDPYCGINSRTYHKYIMQRIK